MECWRGCHHDRVHHIRIELNDGCKGIEVTVQDRAATDLEPARRVRCRAGSMEDAMKPTTLVIAAGVVLASLVIGAPVHARPAASGTHVYLLPDDARVLALDLTTGATVWQATLPGKAVSAAPLDDRVFVGNTDRFFYCLSAKNGKVSRKARGKVIETRSVCSVKHFSNRRFVSGGGA